MKTCIIKNAPPVDAEKRQRAGALQKLAHIRTAWADAKRLGVRQPSAAFGGGSWRAVGGGRARSPRNTGLPGVTFRFCLSSENEKELS